MNYAEFKGRFFKKLKNRSFYIFQPGIIRPSLTLRESRLSQVSPGASPETVPSYIPADSIFRLYSYQSSFPINGLVATPVKADGFPVSIFHTAPPVPVSGWRSPVHWRC